MIKLKKNLTDREFEIMEALWKSDRPLHATELMERTSNISANSIHRIISHLLSRGYIKIAGTVQISKSTSRLYAPLISAEEYTWDQMNKIFKTDSGKSPISPLIMYLAKKNKKKTEDLKQELLDIINNIK
jgi:predicted transcriptional regulator